MADTVVLPVDSRGGAMGRTGPVPAVAGDDVSIKTSVTSRDPVGGAGSAFDHPASGRLCRSKGHLYEREIQENGNWYKETSDTCFRCGAPRKMAKRDIGQEILDSINEIKAGR